MDKGKACRKGMENLNFFRVPSLIILLFSLIKFYCSRHTLMNKFHCMLLIFQYYTVSALGQEIRIYGQLYPFAWRSSHGRSPRELLKVKGYIWPYILNRVLIRTVYHFNSIKANNCLISIWQLFCILPRECTAKYTPCLEVLLKELYLSIPSFRMIYCPLLLSFLCDLLENLSMKCRSQ